MERLCGHIDSSVTAVASAAPVEEIASVVKKAKERLSLW